jgi:NADH-quinone oxidoreductase subunit E
MSMFSLPEDKMTKENPFAAFTGDMTEMQKNALKWMNAAGMPEISGMTNLSAHPMAAMAAASAVGMGIASQMYGMMLGSMTGAMNASAMLSDETTGGPSMPFGYANPFNFDWATGSFEESEAPAETKAPVKTEAPAKTPKLPVQSRSVPEPKESAKAPPAEKPAAKAAAPSPAPAAAEKPAPAVAAPEPVAVETKPKHVPVALAQAAAPVMPEDFVKPKAMKKPDQPDDLKLISGIGPKLEEVLNGMGVYTFGQIAKWKPAEIAWVDDYLQFRGRIERDNWIGQAAEHAKKKS